MDSKTKLNDEKIFYKKTKQIIFLNKKGIYTVEDFINGDAEKMGAAPQTKYQYKAIQKILRYKYLGEPLILDPILDNQYNYNDLETKLKKDFEKLGFDSAYRYAPTCIARERIDKYGSCKMIDILLTKNSMYDTYHLTEFYVDYYKKQNGITAKEIEEMAIEAKVKYLQHLKNELSILLNLRNELDDNISSLSERINNLEEGKINNARK